MACEYCRVIVGHELWCPLVISQSDPNRPPQGVVTEDWARGLLHALGLKPTTSTVATALASMQALHRRANVEGVEVALARVPDVPDPKDAKDQVMVDARAQIAAKRDEMAGIGVTVDG